MENLTNEDLLDEFDLLEKEIEDETTVTDRRLVILERQKELFAQLRINVRRRPTIQEHENLIDKLVGAAAIVQYDHLPKATLESYRLQATEAKAELLRRLGAAVSASPQPRCPVCQNKTLVLMLIGGNLVVGCPKLHQVVIEQFECDGNPPTWPLADFAQFFAAAPAQEPTRIIKPGDRLPSPDREYYPDAAQEQPVENCPQGSLKDFSVAKTLEGFSKEPPQPTVFSPQKGKP